MKNDRSAEIKAVSADMSIQGVLESLVEGSLNSDYKIQTGPY
jgi:hypothetical protein